MALVRTEPAAGQWGTPGRCAVSFVSQCRRCPVPRRVALALVLALLPACAPQRAPENRAEPTFALATPSFTAEEALRAALSSPEAAEAASLFPAGAGSRSCELRAGAALVVPATCRTEVWPDGPTYVVRLTE